MGQSFPAPERLDELPLWRLIILLADAERELGPSSPTTRLVARLVGERLRGEDAKPSDVAVARA